MQRLCAWTRAPTHPMCAAQTAYPALQPTRSGECGRSLEEGGKGEMGWQGEGGARSEVRNAGGQGTAEVCGFNSLPCCQRAQIMKSMEGVEGCGGETKEEQGKHTNRGRSRGTRNYTCPLYSLSAFWCPTASRCPERPLLFDPSVAVSQVQLCSPCPLRPGGGDTRRHILRHRILPQPEPCDRAAGQQFGCLHQCK